MLGTIFSGFEIALVALFIYVLLYTLINRICTCIEMCAMYKATGSMSEENFEKFINMTGKMK